MPPHPTQLDHLVFAGPNLEHAVAQIEDQLGVRVLPGGVHPQWGTRNAIVPLSPSTYLEVIGPNPSDSATRPLLFGIASLEKSRLVTWVAKGKRLGELCAHARSRGIDLGEPRPGTRVLFDGSRLSWELTDPFKPRESGLLPFFIDWHDSSHPGTSGPPQVALTRLYARHPNPIQLREQLRLLGIQLDVETGVAPTLVAVFTTAAGTVTLM